MTDLLHTIVKPLVNNPDAIAITPINKGRTIVLELSVDPSDMGKVIGKQGRRAQAIRAVMKARATLQGKRVIVDIVG
ncbi:MAG: KH domain-containing protein [Clostridiaceae bacterium]|nr:KH domain-containing protein [Eubacteriales bacterium]NLV48132.1 KH domain-containing protein [Clostridiaceae bacterium]